MVQGNPSLSLSLSWSNRISHHPNGCLMKFRERSEREEEEREIERAHLLLQRQRHGSLPQGTGYLKINVWSIPGRVIIYLCVNLANKVQNRLIYRYESHTYSFLITNLQNSHEWLISDSFHLKPCLQLHIKLICATASKNKSLIN